MRSVLRLLVLHVLGYLAAVPASAQVQSDDFHCPILANFWSLQDPTGDGSQGFVGSGTSEAYLTLSFSAGTPHDAWGAVDNESIRIMQISPNTDFEIEVKWLTEPAGGFNDQGVLVQQDADDWLRFDVYHNNGSLKLFVGTTIGGTNSTILNADIPAGSASYLRISRSGDTWTTSTSADGTSFQVQNAFDQSLTVSSAGVYAANPVEGLSWTSEVDYFFNTASPISPEDPGTIDECFPTPTEQVSWGAIKSRF